MKMSKKIQVQFPANPRLLVSATLDVLSSLANLLSYFSANEIDDALPKTKKGKDTHHETRNVASPRYISEAIAGILSVWTTTYCGSRQTNHGGAPLFGCSLESLCRQLF
jgi:hypothetical protein